MEAWRAPLAEGDVDNAWKLFIERYRRLIFSVIRRSLDNEDDIEEVFADVCASLAADNLARPSRQQDTGKARFTTWLVTVVHNHTIDWIRHRDGRRRVVVPDGLTEIQREIFIRLVAERRSQSEAFEIMRQSSSWSLSYSAFLREVAALYHTLQSAGKSVVKFFPGPPLEILQAEPDPSMTLLAAESSQLLAKALKILSPDERLAVQLFVVDELPAASVAKIVGWPNAKSVYNRVPRALERLRRELGITREPTK